MRYLNLLLIFVPLAIVGSFLGWNELLLFWAAAIGVVPLAGLMGQATEALAELAGPRVGGLLNATLGNAAELIITIVAIREGLVELVKASITGSILGTPPGRQRGRAPSGGADGAQEPDGAEPEHLDRLKFAGCSVRRAGARFHQPAGRASIDAGFQPV